MYYTSENGKYEYFLCQVQNTGRPQWVVGYKYNHNQPYQQDPSKVCKHPKSPIFNDEEKATKLYHKLAKQYSWTLVHETEEAPSI